MEDHIESGWVSLEEFKKARVLPVLLKEKIIQWMKDKEKCMKIGRKNIFKTFVVYSRIPFWI